MKLKSFIIFAVVGVLLCFTLTGCSLFQDPDDFPTNDDPISEPIQTNVKEETKHGDDAGEKADEIVDNLPSNNEPSQESGEPGVLDDNNSGEAKPHEQESGEPVPIEEKNPVKINPDSFADSARYSTFEKPILMGEAGKVLLQNFTGIGDVWVAMRVERKLSDEEVKEIIAKKNNTDSILKIDINKPGSKWNAVLVSYDLKDYPTNGEQTILPYNSAGIYNDINKPYFYNDDNKPCIMESFNYRDREDPIGIIYDVINQGDIYQIYIIYETLENYTGPVYLRIANSYGEPMDNKYSFFKIDP